MKTNKWIIAVFFFLILGYGTSLAWAGSQSVSATVRVTIPPRIQISLGEDSNLSFSQWLNEKKETGRTNILEEKKGGITIYTISDKI